MANNVDTMFQATLHNLREHLRVVPYPMPVSGEADLAAIVSRAFLYGAAFVAEACNLEGQLYVAKASAIMNARARERGPGGGGALILPGDKDWLH